MADFPADPLMQLRDALAVTPNSNEQADLLGTLRESLEAYPGPIPILCTTLISTLSGAGDSLLKRWVLDLLHYAICRSTLSLDTRTQLASQSLDALSTLLSDPNPFTVKVVVQCFTSVYPLLFRMLCTNRNLRQQWNTLAQAKGRILEFVWSPIASAGVKLSSIKFLQRVIVVQTRGVTDPRLQNKNDPNLSFVAGDHPFIPVPALEAEGMKLVESVITLLYTNKDPDLVTAIVNSWAQLVKLRPALVNLVVSALTSWTPAALVGLPASSIKSVEKAVRILLVHISRSPNGLPYSTQISEALSIQAQRMDKATRDERDRKVAAAAAANASVKRPASAMDENTSEAKRAKLEHSTSTSTSASSFLAHFDFTSLPAALITELIVANLQAYTEPAFVGIVQIYRESAGLIEPAPLPPEPVVVKSEPAAPVPDVTDIVTEPVDPLQMDIDEDEIEYEPDKLNLELSGDDLMSMIDGREDLLTDVELIDLTLQLSDFKLPPPKSLSEDDRQSLLQASLTRIRTSAGNLHDVPELAVDASPEKWPPHAELGMMLLVRMVTRGFGAPAPPSNTQEEQDEPKRLDGIDQASLDVRLRQDRLRQTLCDYVLEDLPSRVRLATSWMNEEWYNDQIHLSHDPTWPQNYDAWLNQIVVSYQAHLDTKDRTFSRFLLDLPSVPLDVLGLLRDLCVDQERMQVGFSTLRDFVSQRPPLRQQAMKILLDLTTHPEKVTRGAAIITVKRWVPDVQPMDGMVRQFALQMLRRLQTRLPPEKPADVEPNGDMHDENMEDGQLPQEELVQTDYLPDELELPAQNAHILQHVELLFSLCVKMPDFLDEIFTSYAHMAPSVQEAIQDLITALIRSLGSSHGKLLTLMRTFPPGSESLALRVLTIFTESGRPSAPLVALVKGLITERDLDARFLIPIIAEMDKPDIMRHLPRIVSMLNGKPEEKNLVRSVFGAIVTTPPQTFGSVTSNLPRVRQSELLTPAELMVLLHESEKEIGLKAAIEAIGICFSMTDVFRSEILAVVMQQIVDEPVLPVLFLRTVIQAVTTYKSLVGFVSTTLLSRLITKKIWTNPPLWEGFIRCAKAIAPASFSALLQLPKDQIRELVDKQPGLKSGLREYVLRKAGNKARVAGFLDLFGEDEPDNPTSPQPQPVPVTLA